MKIYDFSLCNSYELTGVDSAISYRTNLLLDKGYNIKNVFCYAPSLRDLQVYQDIKVDLNTIISTPLFFTDFESYKSTTTVEDILFQLSELYDYDQTKASKNRIEVYKNGCILAVIITWNDSMVSNVQYWRNGWQERTEFFSDKRYYSEYYKAVANENGYYAQKEYGIYYNKNGSIAFTQIMNEKQEEINVFPDGSRYSSNELFELFVSKLNLTKEDIVILDRPFQVFPLRPIFEKCDTTNIISIFHSEHYLQKGYSVTGINLSREYWYWFRNSNCIKSMIVSTEEQKEVLTKDLLEDNRYVPNIEVIPIMGVSESKYNEKRKNKTIICVSRLFESKRIDWTILATIKAHKIDNEISLDIYGDGRSEYVAKLKKLVKDNDAESFINFKGFTNVTEVYKQYKLYLSTSISETFGITLLEAVSSGLAMIGLDVRYGNKNFIKDGINGYLIPYEPENFSDFNQLIDDIANKIVEILNDDEKFLSFSEQSYKIASEYKEEEIANKWQRLFDKLT